MKIYYLLLLLLLLGCDVEVTESTVYGCCDTEAWNYSSDVTAHADSLCIYNFDITNPTNQNVWPIGSNQSINWSGGDTNLDVRISIIDAATELDEVLISGDAENNGLFNWTVNVNPYSSGLKKLYFLQDLNSDGIYDTLNDLISFSDDFVVQDQNLPNFEFLTPVEGDIWEEGSSQIISWTGGDPNLDISLYLIDVNTNTTTGIIQAGVSNTGTYQWNVSCFDCLDGPKTIYIEQDTDLDGNIDLFIQSDEFSID